MNTPLKLIQAELDKTTFGSSPKELYDPVSYILSMGGKRLRSQLALLSYGLFKDDIHLAVKPALALEVFHNFTLIHDDVMDEAPMRRGKATVHKVWNVPTAILSGDVMLVSAYNLLLSAPSDKLLLIMQRFNKCAIKVCEGQQWDMSFEKCNLISEEEYINMISLKTAALIGFSMELGALLAGAPIAIATELNEIGTLVGIGFQLKDDLLDLYADQGEFGKQIGGDIISNKKTFLLIKSLELAKNELALALKKQLANKATDQTEKVLAVKRIYDQLEIEPLTLEKMNQYFAQAEKKFTSLDVLKHKKEALGNLLTKLINRDK